MDRGASAAFLAELAKQKSQPFHLVELQLDSGTIYATDASRDIAFNGNTYPALAHFLEFSGIRETTELQVSQCTVALSGVDQTLIAAVLGEDYLDRRLVIYKGFLSEDVWVDLPGSASNHVNTPDSSPVSVTGDLTLIAKIRADDYTPSVSSEIFNHHAATGNQRGYTLIIATSGLLFFRVSTDGIADRDFSSTVALSTVASNGSDIWIKVALDIDNGVGGQTTRFYYSTNGVTWTQLGADVTVAGTGSLFNSNRPLTLGANSFGNANFLAGRIYRAQVWDGESLVVDFDPSRFAVGSLTAKMQTGETWTINQSGADPARTVYDQHRVVVDPIAIFDGRCDEPVIAENPEDGKCTVAIDAASHWVDFERRPGRHTNHEEQQLYFPGDTFFSRVSELGKPIIWGRGTGSAAAVPRAAKPAPQRFTTDGNNRGTGRYHRNDDL